MSCSFPHVKIFRLEQFTSNFLKNGPKTSQNNFGWLYRARAVLSMLFSGYSCSADPFARYRAGQFSPVLVHGRKLPTKSRITLKFCPKTTLAGCIAPAKSFQHYLLGTGLLRTRSRDSVLLVIGRQRPMTFLYCSKCRALLALTPPFTSIDKCWTDSAIWRHRTKDTTRATTTTTNRCKLLLYNWQSCNNPNLKLFHLCGAG